MAMRMRNLGPIGPTAGELGAYMCHFLGEPLGGQGPKCLSAATFFYPPFLWPPRMLMDSQRAPLRNSVEIASDSQSYADFHFHFYTHTHTLIVHTRYGVAKYGCRLRPIDKSAGPHN